MTLDTYQKLNQLHEKYGAQEFGKLCQKLLAISFRKIGCNHVVERGVQGVDVDAAGIDGDKYAVEVKTTKQDSINFEKKDANGLRKRETDGYRPLLAVLRLVPLSEWYFASVSQLRVGRITADSLRPYRHKELEKRIEPKFDSSTKEHFAGAIQEGQAYLDRVLRQEGVEIPQS